MAIIPDVADMQVANPNLQQDIGSTPDLGKPLQFHNMGAGGAKLVDEMYQRQIRSEVAKAKTQLQLGKIEQDEAYAQDQDVDTIEDRWNGAMMDHLGKAATNITDGQVRDAFVQEGQLVVENGRANMRQFAFKRKADQEISYTENASDTLLKAAISPTGDIPGSFDAVESSWNSMAEQGYTTHENAQEQIRATKLKIAVSKIQTMTPHDQLEALTSDWAQEIPLNTRTQLERAARDLMRIGAAQTAAFAARENGLSESQAADSFYEQFKGEPEILLEAQRQYSILKSNDKKSVTAMSTELYNRYDVGLRAGDISTAVIRETAPADWEAMTPAMRNNLELLEANRVNKPIQYSDRGVLSQLMQRFKAEDWDAAKEYFYENSAKLNASDYEDWLDKVHVGRPQGLFDAQFQTEQLTVGMGKKRKAAIYNSMTNWYVRYQVDNKGTEPGPEEITKHLNQAIKDYDTGPLQSDIPAEMSDEDSYDAYENLEPDEREDFLSFHFDHADQNRIALRYYKENYNAAYLDVIDFYRGQGVAPQDIQRDDFKYLMGLYQKKNNLPEVQ